MSECLAIVEKFYAAFKASEWERVNALFAPDCMTVTPAGAMNVQQHEQFGRAFKTAMPDGHMAVKNAVTAGEWIAVEGNFRGKHEKDLVGPSGTVPALGKALDLRYGDFFRVKGGKIVEHRVYWDQMDMLTQLGAMPAPGTK